MDREKLLERLMGTFLEELEEHVRALNRDLLALERTASEPERSELLKTVFRRVHSLKGAGRSVGVQLIERTCHQLEEILGAARDGGKPLEPELHQLLFAAVDAIEDAGRRLRAKEELGGGALARVLPHLEAAGRGGSSAGGRVLATAPAPRRGESPMQAGVARAAGAVARAPSLAAHSAAASESASIRVSCEKLDGLLARSGELLIARLRVEGNIRALGELRESVGRWKADWTRNEGSRSASALLSAIQSQLRSLEKDLGRLSASAERDGRALAEAARQLEGDVQTVRMLPFEEACQGLERAVRDLALALGKEVDLSVQGGDVSLDRSILESLKDPLLHLVRNSVAHGLESPDERRAAGKPPRGSIRVAAALRGSRVEVTVSDDGRGLDLEAIRDRARSRNLPRVEDDRALAGVVFLPGFSTAPVVSEISGRGVGLDMVKAKVESVLGTIDLASDPGRGLRIRIDLPLTLTTIRALLVAASRRIFAIPSTNVSKILRIRRDEFRTVERRSTLPFDGRLVPAALLAETLDLEPHEPACVQQNPTIVVVMAGEQHMAFQVDELLGEQEIVVKSLGARIGRVPGLSGASLLPTGRIALILNVPELVHKALASPPHGPSRLAQSETSTTAKRRRLLVVDDSLTARSLERRILEAAGYEVLMAADGQQAWRLLENESFDLVVSDVEMPNMDGFALTKAIRDSSQLRNLPVVLLTACDNEESRLRGIEAGANAYLVKSAFEQSHLLDVIGQLL